MESTSQPTSPPPMQTVKPKYLILTRPSKGDLHQEYTRSNFFVKGGKVTTPTITGDIFPPCDVKNTLIKLNNQLPNFSHMPTHLSLTHSLLTLYNVALNLAHC